MVTEPTQQTDPDTPPVRRLADRLRADYGDAVVLTHHDDDTPMTPMLSVSVDGGRTRAAVLRDAFAFERRAALSVTAVHRHRIVVRAD